MNTTNFVSTFEAACERLNRSTALPDVSMWPERLQRHLIALFKLDTILEVNNNGWVPDLANTSQWKHYPWFRIEKDANEAGGFRLSCSGYDYDCTVSYLGARLACETEELAEYMGENCAELYKDLHL